MLELNPPMVLAHESVVASPVYQKRLQSVVDALSNPREPIIYRDEELPSLLKEHQLLSRRVAMGTLETIPDPVLLLNTFRFDGQRQQQHQWLKQQGIPTGGLTADGLLGYGPFAWFPANLAADPYRQDKVCRPCWRLHFQNGCVHQCHYCGFGGLLLSMVNVEDYIHHLDQLIQAHPWQETYLFEDDADVLCLEPELGCLAPLIEYFGTLEDRYLIIHTKSWNVDWMLDLKHNGNTIIVWSLAGPTQSTVLEPKTGTTAQRIDAARKCEEVGYTIRYKFKPIIPVKNWRDDASETIRLALEQTNPDVISLCCFMWMTADELKRRLAPEMLDSTYLAAAEEAVDEMADTRAKPFPEWVRAEIYEHHFREIRRWNPGVPVSLSTENWAMWKRLSPVLGTNATDYVCGCGPNSVPWRKQLCDHPFRIATKSESPQFELM